MKNFFIRVFSFFKKEIHDVRRQPRLLISLVGGPLLVLAAFGATFRSANPFITTALVWPENGIPGFEQEQAEKFISSNFTLLDVTNDEEEAMAWLEAGQVDVIQVIPEVSLSEGPLEARPEIKIISNSIDPNAEAWIRSLAYGEKNYINQQILFQEANQAQDKAAEVSLSLQSAQDDFRQINLSINGEDIEALDGNIKELRAILLELAEYLPSRSFAQANFSTELANLHRDLDLLLDDLTELENLLGDEELLPKIERLENIDDEISNLRGTIDVFATTPPQNIITPFKESYTNLRGSAYSLVIFYAPAVLALLVQQLSITLASLGLVRERQMGAFEMFRVSPLKFSQILVGKSLAYVVYVTMAGLVLTFLLGLINVPIPANFLQYFLLLVLLAIASVGIGFLISATAKTDSQAIQMSMLVLLLSVFFTSFFLPITGFAWPAWIIALLLPMTHAITGFQEVMLAGVSIDIGVWIGLALIILLSYGIVMLIMRRQYKKAVD